VLLSHRRSATLPHWLPIDIRIEFKIFTITFKARHGIAPAYIKDLKNHYPPRDLKYSKKNLLAVPVFNANSYDYRAFSVGAPLLWNSLPQRVRDAGSLHILKELLFLDALFRFMKWLWYIIT